MSDEPRRKNGLELPFHELQVATWLLYPILLVHYFALLMPLLWRHMAVQVLITFLFCLSSILAVIFGYITCAIDPIDSALVTREEATTAATNSSCCCGGFLAVSNSPSNEDESNYCYYCETHVCVSSKHCQYCNKCVERFDHHCKWLNTCVGAKNYRYFLAAVAGVTVETSISLALSLAYLIEAYAYSERFQHRVESSNLVLTAAATGYVMIISVAILTPLVGLVYQLAGFHCNLLYQGITTYDFIINEMKRKREITAQREQAKLEKLQQKQALRLRQQQQRQEQLRNKLDSKHTNQSNNSEVPPPAHQQPSHSESSDVKDLEMGPGSAPKLAQDSESANAQERSTSHHKDGEEGSHREIEENDSSDDDSEGKGERTEQSGVAKSSPGDEAVVSVEGEGYEMV